MHSKVSNIASFYSLEASSSPPFVKNKIYQMTNVEMGGVGKVPILPWLGISDPNDCFTDTAVGIQREKRTCLK